MLLMNKNALSIHKRIIATLFTVCVIGLLGSPALSAQPEDDPIDKQATACMDRNPSTQGMIECLQQAYAQWDAALNTVYADVRLRLNPQAQNALKESQRLWIAYRDAEFLTIDAIYGSMQGTMWIVAGMGQKVEFVKCRVIELRAYADNLSQSN